MARSSEIRDENGGDWRAELREARRALGLTQQQLAERAGISLHTVRAYERGARRPPREQLEKVFAALKVPNAQANAIREHAGYAPVRSLFTAEFEHGYFYAADELPAAVEGVPWPEFVVKDTLELIAANRAVCALWGIDLERERGRRSRAQMNLLSVASDRRFADAVLNWDECIGVMIGVFKGARPRPLQMDEGNPYLDQVLAAFAGGDPAFLRRLLDAWNTTEAREPKVRWTYPVVWRDEECGTMRFLATVSTASEPDALSFNDWVPVDAESWRVLELVKQRAK